MMSNFVVFAIIGRMLIPTPMARPPLPTDTATTHATTLTIPAGANELPKEHPDWCIYWNGYVKSAAPCPGKDK